MSYIGNTPTSIAFLTDLFTGTGSLSVFTMSAAPASTSSILVSITGVVQEPSTYAVSGNTLTFSQAPPAGTGNISVRYLGIPASNIVSTAYRTVTEFTATLAQTIFTVPSYTVGYITVYRNGARLGAADYTATSGTNVILTVAANTGDLVTTESFYVSSVLNAIPAVAGAVTSSYIIPNVSLSSPSYTGTLTGGTGILNIGSGQVYKDASGNVGIGASSPGAILHTSKTSVAAATVGAFIQNSDNTVGTEVRLGFAANTNLPSQERYGWIGYVNTGGTNGGALTFATTIGGTPATERMRIDSSGNVALQKNISVGAAAPTTSGTGITFPSTASPSTDAYTLDDYREGTWTPTLTGFTLSGTDSSVYRYTKIGRSVTINVLFYASTSYTIATNATMTLPFTPTRGGTGVAVSENTGLWGFFVANGGNLVFKGGVGASQGITLSFSYIV